MTTDTNPSRKNRARATKLKTIQDVAIEMARCYRSTKHGDIESAHGYRMTMMLAALKQCLESSEVERRLAEIEALIANRATIAPFKPKLIS